MKESNYIQIQTTTDSHEEADNLTKVLLESKLVACVKRIENVSSNYLWDGKIENSEEIILLINTTKDNYQKTEEMIKKNHHYETPEIIANKIKHGSSDYLGWIDEVTR